MRCELRVGHYFLAVAGVGSYLSVATCSGPGFDVEPTNNAAERSLRARSSTASSPAAPDQRPDAESPAQGGDQDKTGVGNQPLVVELGAERIEPHNASEPFTM